MSNRFRAGRIVLIAALATGAAARGQETTAPETRAWRGTVTIPTYPLGADDVNPHFRELNDSIIYPYAMQDRFGDAPVSTEHRAVFLENDYLRVMVLPDIGGRIQSVLDKVTGEEMFYRNHVIRPGHIALRGAWVSGGVEWNRGPQGHTVTSFSPVDVVPVGNPDGSASIVIGSTEQNFRTGWQVRLTLLPGGRYLDEQIRLFNPTDGMHPYYFWNNTAFPNRPGTRFIFPMTLGTDHDGLEFFEWPIHEGRDLSWLRNYPQPTSVFGVDVAHDFFGAYDVDRDFGIVQVADHHLLPGKKAWTWGEAEAGLVAQSVLTDDDGPYIEVQSGPLPTQSDYGLLMPGQELSWSETWYPAAGLGDGFEYATRHAAVQRANVDGAVELRLYVTHAMPGAELIVERQGGRTERRQLDLAPERTEQIVIDTSGVTDQPATMRLQVRLHDAAGNELLAYRSPLPIPARQPPTRPQPGDSPDAAFRRADVLDRAMDRSGARAALYDILAQDPGHALSLQRLGSMDLESGLPARAAERLLHSLERAPDDGMTWVLLGAARLASNDLDGAVDAASEAIKRAGTAALGHQLIGRVHARRGDPVSAADAFTSAITAGGSSWTRSFEQILIATYAAGDRRGAQAIARQAIAGGTVRLVPYAVAALAGNGGALEFARSTRDWVGEAEFSYLETALAFADQALFQDAAAILEATLVNGVDEARRRPLPLYYLAYYSAELADASASRRWMEAARAARAEYVFPSRPETEAVLRFAVDSDPTDARAWMYLGNLYAGLGRLDEAAAAWRSAAQHGPGLSIARRNLGLHAAMVEGDPDAAESWLQQAISARPSDQTLYRDLARLHTRNARPDDAVRVLEAAPSEGRRADVTVDLARAYLRLQRYDDAIALLASTTFTNREGDSGTWQVFSAAHVQRGEQRLAAGDTAAARADFEAALTYPRNLNAGRPYRHQEARARYGLGAALLQGGDRAGARAAWLECAQGHPGTAEQNEYLGRCREAAGTGQL